MDFAEVRSLNGPFDVILLLSALHYASGPAKLISDLMEMLTSDGVFILECGIAPGAEKKWVSVGRDIDDVVQHPTRAMLMDLFDRASVRTVGLSVHQPGDPVPRQVFHIRHLRPIVLLVSGPSLSGKTTILAALGRASSINPINLDYFLAHMVEWSEQPMLVDLGNARDFRTDRLYELVDEMTRAGVEDQFVEEFVDKHARIVTADARPITVIEGFALSRGKILVRLHRTPTPAGLLCVARTAGRGDRRCSTVAANDASDAAGPAATLECSAPPSRSAGRR